ncbi:MAG: SAM-dependent methyltransferase [Anaerolineaceae bacterium]|nr:SAM-dependent methyltransferase [Anaerolineaceae bacterium]
MPTEDYRETIKQIVMGEDSFVSLTLKGKVRGEPVPWRMITARPILIKDHWHLQVSRFDARQDTTKNYTGEAAEVELDAILAIPYSSVQVRTTEADLDFQITKKGKAILHRHAPSVETPDFAHDSSKALPIPAGEPDSFMQAVGIMNDDGSVKANMQGKFAQINEFLKLLDHTRALDSFDHSPVTILDCGCGSSYLTFAAYHYINDIRGIPAHMDGVDTNAGLIEKSTAYSLELNTAEVCFYNSPIIDYVPETPPDIVLALHACDTATDEALFQGIHWGTGLILAVPCCHHHLHEQLENGVDPFRPVMRHGILKKRMVDILTDSFRALILRIMGYKTDVVEFVSSEHTDRNLMIRAVKRTAPGDPAFLSEYAALKAFWDVTPYLETLLGDSFPAG